MRLACSTASFPRERLPMALARVAWAGFPAVEVHAGPDALPDAAELRSLLAAKELELAAIHAGALPASAGAAGLEALARIGRAADLACRLDGRLVVVDAPRSGRLESLVEALRELDAALGRLEVDICLANGTETLLASRESLAALWGAGLPARVGLALDPGRALLAGWDPLDLDALPEPPRHVYLNDAAGGRVTPPGEGDLDAEELLRRLRRRGCGGCLSLRLENADPWEVEPLAKQIAASF